MQNKHTETGLRKVLKSILTDLQQLADGEITPKQARKRLKKVARKAQKARTKAGYQVNQATLVLYTRIFEHQGNMIELPRITIKRDTALPSLLEHVVRGMDQQKLFPLPVCHIRNEQMADERGHVPPVDERVLKAGSKAEMAFFSSRHLLPKGLLPLVKNTFPTAIEARAYMSGLMAATIGNGLWSNIPLVICDMTSVNANGEVILALADGHGLIHPDHPWFEVIGSVCVVQIRIWNPSKGFFFKGILIPDNRAVMPYADADGNALPNGGEPAIHLDWLQGKGRHKARCKQYHGLKSGAFGPDNVLIDPTKLQVAITGDGYHCGILQKWDKPTTIKCCFEWLQMIKQNPTTEKIIDQFLDEAIADFWNKGGMKGIFDRLAEDDPAMDTIGQLCEAVGANPLGIGMIYARVLEESKRFLYHLAQGAGKKTDSFELRMDDAVPKGYVVIGTFPGFKARYQHGDKVAVTRMPSLLPQGHMVLTVIDPFYTDEDGNRPYQHLEYLAIKTEKGLKLVSGVATIGIFDTRSCAGDSDGDALMVDDDPRSVVLFENRITFMGNSETVFLTEPEKDAGGAKTKILTVEPDGSCSEEATLLMGLDGRGPVGADTMFQAGYIAVGDGMGALATAALAQRAVDLQKHTALLPCPERATDPQNWEEVEPNVYKLRDGCHANNYWYDSSGGGDKLDVKKLAIRFKEQTGFKLSDVLTWRKDNSKKIVESEWEQCSSEAGENLVHYCNNSAHRKWFAAKEKHGVSDSRDVELLPLLPNALNVDTAGYTVDLTDPSALAGYRELLNRSGLVAYGKALQKAKEEKLPVEVRNARIDAETALLGQALRDLTRDEILCIWCTELSQIQDAEKGFADSKVNRAVRAVCFEGSPVLAELGIEVNFPCAYMQGGKLNEVYDLLEQSVGMGQARDIFEAVARWEATDSLHEVHTGVSASECNHCKDMIVAKVVASVRAEKFSDHKAEVARVASAMNDALGHSKYRN